IQIQKKTKMKTLQTIKEKPIQMSTYKPLQRKIWRTSANGTPTLMPLAAGNRILENHVQKGPDNLSLEYITFKRNTMATCADSYSRYPFYITGCEINNSNSPTTVLWQFDQEKEIASCYGYQEKATRNHLGFILIISVKNLQQEILMDRYVYSDLMLMHILISHTMDSTTMRAFLGHQSRIRSIAIDTNNKSLITGSTDGEMKIWDTSIYKLKQIIDVQPRNRFLAPSFNRIPKSAKKEFFVEADAVESPGLSLKRKLDVTIVIVRITFLNNIIRVSSDIFDSPTNIDSRQHSSSKL
ncbi:hypothetical protein CU098_000715, partial [Rhizopus stolonifer]